jgi:hypothetical protein
VRGIVMGNPFIDPRAQAGSEIEMMVEAKLWEKGGKVRAASPASALGC